MAYTEQLGLQVLWPDFTVEHLHEALAYYQDQPRKFGKVV
jgi:undecaprenyl pyrophosphate synthase